MARPLRIDFPGAQYYLSNLGNIKQPLFKHEEDRELFLEKLQQVCDIFKINVEAYSFSEDGYYLLLKAKEGNLSKAMHNFLTSFSKTYNRKYNRKGSLFFGRYRCLMVENKQEYVSKIVNYIFKQAGRVDKHRIYEQQWCSYPMYSGQVEAPEWLQQNNVQKMIKEINLFDIVSNSNWSPMNEAVGQSIFGSDKFVKKFLGSVKDITTKKETLSKSMESRKLTSYVEPDIIIKHICNEFGFTPEELISTNKELKNAQARKVLFYLVGKMCVGGYSLQELSQKLNLNFNTFSQRLAGYDEKLKKKRTLKGKINRITENIKQELKAQKSHE